MIDYSVDIGEIISFINSCHQSVSVDADAKKQCIDAFTAITGEDYLDKRGEAVRAAILPHRSRLGTARSSQRSMPTAKMVTR